MVFLGADHAGFAAKDKLIKYLVRQGIAHTDLGAHAYDAHDDYPDFAKTVAKKVASSQTARGILLCGSGQGVCIAANKIKGVRAALAWNEASAKACRQDDDANILCLPGRLIPYARLERIVAEWLKTPFSKLARHKRRIKKIE